MGALGALSEATAIPGQEGLNIQAQDFTTWVNESKVGKAVAQGVQAMTETGADYGIPIAALWKRTEPFLKKLSPEHFASLSKSDKRALETLTESYPSVRNSSLITGLEDAFRDQYKNLPEQLIGAKPGEITLTYPKYYTHPLEKKLSSPAISYAHEGAHAFTGGSGNLAGWTSDLDEFARPSVEGFAEGFSHALLNKFNKDVLAPYWWEYRAKPGFKDVYTASGYHGVDVANSIKGGNIPDQRDAIQELMNILSRY